MDCISGQTVAASQKLQDFKNYYLKLFLECTEMVSSEITVGINPFQDITCFYRSGRSKGVFLAVECEM